MNDLTVKDTMTTLELVEQINLFRKEEGSRAELKHKTLLEIIRDEFEDEIGLGKVVFSHYKNSQNKEQPMYILTPSQAKQIFIRTKSKPTREFCEKYSMNIEFNIVSKTRFEISFGKLLTEALEELGLEIIPQYRVDNYRVDFYIPSKNIVVEYDEQQHFTEANQKNDSERQKHIESKLCCKFVRCDYRDSDIKNVVKVIKEVM